MEHITRTGERWRKRNGMIEVVLSTAMQEDLGTARFAQLPAIGTFARAGEYLGVIEGTRRVLCPLRWPRGLGREVGCKDI